MTEVTSDNKTHNTNKNTSLSVPSFLSSILMRIQKFSPKMGRMIGYRLLRLSIEMITSLLGVIFLWFYAINYVVTQDEVDVSFLGRNAEIWFSEAFNGHGAKIGSLTLDWKAAENRILFSARNISIQGKDGQEIERIKRFQSEVGVRAAILGRLKATRLSIDGGMVSWVRNKNGKMVMGLGAPEHVGSFGPVWTGSSQKRQVEKTRFLGRPPNILFPKDLNAFDLINGRAFIVDKRDGVELTLVNTKIIYRKTGPVIQSSLEAELNKRASTETDESLEMQNMLLQDPQTLVPIKLMFETQMDMRDFDFSLAFENLNPSHYAPARGAFTVLQDYDLPITASMMVMTGRESGLKTATLKLDAGAGQIKARGVNETVQNFGMTTRYDHVNNSIEINDIDIATQNYSGQGRVVLESVFNGKRGLSEVGIPISIDLENVRIDGADVFESAFKFDKVKSSALFTPSEKELVLKETEFDFGDFVLALDMYAKFGGQDTPIEASKISLAIKGSLSEKDLIRLWPLKFAKGARDWIKRSVSNAQVTNLKAALDLTQEHFQGAPLGDENLEMTFDIPKADIRYISTMTPYTRAVGSGWMRGNKAQFQTTGGQVGDLIITRGQVDFPQLFPKGGLLKIDLDASGDASDMLALIDQPPFRFASQYGVNPMDFVGKGSVNLKITRPLLVNFDRSKITYSGVGEFSGVGGPFGFGPHKITQGDVRLQVNKQGMSVSGPVFLGPWRTDMTMRETFDEGATPTQYTLKGPMTQSDLDRFGLGLRAYFGGFLNIEAMATGTGVNITQASIKADLTASELSFGGLWGKSVGEPALMKGMLKRAEDGSLSFERINMKAPGLNAVANIGFTSDFKLVNLDIPEILVEGVLDGKLNAVPNEQGDALNVQISGKSLDISPFTQSMISGAPSEFKVPVNIKTQIETLILNPSYVLKNATLDFLNRGIGVEWAEITGQTRTGPFSASLMPDTEEGGRKAKIMAPNAADLVFAFLDMSNISGGILSIDAELPDVGVKGMVRGTVNVDDFNLIEAPILAQLLSVASLQGLTDLLGGTGLSFKTLNIPFGWEDGNLSIRDARASGPALGLTGSGEINFLDETLDLDGVLVPAYTANSVLGDIPILGDLFVGKKGEGVFALNYTIKGTMKKSQIAVNPLSALTPGFLRRIFDVKRRDIEMPTPSSNEGDRPKDKE